MATLVPKHIFLNSKGQGPSERRTRSKQGYCRNEMLLAVSCHGRYSCPLCHAKRVAAFADWLAAELLDDTPYRQRLHLRKGGEG